MAFNTSIDWIHLISELQKQLCGYFLFYSWFSVPQGFFYVKQQVSQGSSVSGTLRTELNHLFASRPAIDTLTQYSHTNWVPGGYGCFALGVRASAVTAPFGASSACSCTEQISPVTPWVHPSS